VALQGRDLVITRPDGPPVVVQNFLAAANASLPSAVTLGNGVVVPARELITVTQQIGSATVSDVIGSRVAQVAPAAAAPTATPAATPTSTTSHTTTSSTAAPLSVSTGNNDSAGVRSQAQTTTRGEVGAPTSTLGTAAATAAAAAPQAPAGRDPATISAIDAVRLDALERGSSRFNDSTAKAETETARAPAPQAPVDLQLSSTTAWENAPNAVVGLLRATDPDGGTHTYSIVPGAHGAQFTIVGNELRVNGSLNYEAGGERTIAIQVTDETGLSKI